jgi:hypothetical protein
MTTVEVGRSQGMDEVPEGAGRGRGMSANFWRPWEGEARIKRPEGAWLRAVSERVEGERQQGRWTAMGSCTGEPARDGGCRRCRAG